MYLPRLLRCWPVKMIQGAMLGALFVACAAQAQTTYPMGSLLGNATFGTFPQLSINCTDYTLGPGVRVLSAQRRIIPTAQLSGIQSPVVFQTDASGNVFRIWLVQPAAVAQLQVPRAPGQCGLYFSN